MRNLARETKTERFKKTWNELFPIKTLVAIEKMLLRPTRISKSRIARVAERHTCEGKCFMCPASVRGSNPPKCLLEWAFKAIDESAVIDWDRVHRRLWRTNSRGAAKRVTRQFAERSINLPLFVVRAAELMGHVSLTETWWWDRTKAED